MFEPVIDFWDMDKNNSAEKKVAPNQKLYEARLHLGWTQKEVADKIGLPESRTVGRWEHGTSFPSPHYRRELSGIFGKSLEELGLLKREDDIPLEGDSTVEPFNNLPAPFTSFVGRRQEVQDASTLLMQPDVRLLTLSGTGGIGKTRLAIEVAAQVREQFADGVCFVALEVLHDPASVLPIIAATLGIQDSQGVSLEQQVKTVLYKKHLLLLLDNFEHMLGAAPFLEALLAACPQVKVLVTSRALLQLQAEQSFVVPPLSLPTAGQPLVAERLTQYAAVALFKQRVQSYLPLFKITENNAHAIADLCVRLDGLPLAIELAAARIKLFSPQALLERLSQDQHILTNDFRDIPERHRTLYYLIQWSYDLLDEQEQWLFRHLSVFAGGVSLPTIEAVFGTIIQPASKLLETVTSLLNKSLLQRIEQDTGEPRFVMLGTIRTYALDCLQEQGETQERRRAHAMHYLALVERATPYLKSPQQVDWLQQLEQELANLRAALHWLIEQQETELALYFCEGFGKFCGLRGYWREEQSWLNAVLILPQQTAYQSIRGKVLRRAGHLAYRFRDLAEARTLLEQSVACSRAVNDLQNLTGALSSLGWVLYRQQERDAASQVLKACLEMAYLSEDDWVLANSLESLGRWMHAQGKLDDAQELLEQSVAIARARLDGECLARFLTTLVKVEVAQGKRERAMEHAQESFALAQKLGNKPLIALALDRLGEIALFQGDSTQAKDSFEERIAIAEELGDTPSIIEIKLKLADITLQEGDFKRTRPLVNEALELSSLQEDPSNVVIAHRILGDWHRLQGDVAQAKSCYQQGMQSYKGFGDKSQMMSCLIGFVQLLQDQGNFEDVASLSGAIESHLGSRDLCPKQLQQASDLARSQLGEEHFMERWQQGFSTSLEQVLATF
jgi:predicted ATPase/transcriptional regulator with XRE-family HTH domain/Tfp pilus assembly protein PilF